MESWHQDGTWYGKPPTQKPHAKRNHGGIGIWIHNSILNSTSIFTPTATQKDILWIQILTGKKPLFFAIIYSHPNDMPNHQSILDTLMKNALQLNKLGTFLFMGDFNSHHQDVRLKTLTRYDKLFTNMLNKSNVTPLTNQTQVNNRNHWTFYNKTKGKAVNDYVLVPLTQQHKFFNFQVHPTINLPKTTTPQQTTQQPHP